MVDATGFTAEQLQMMAGMSNPALQQLMSMPMDATAMSALHGGAAPVITPSLQRMAKIQESYDALNSMLEQCQQLSASLQAAVTYDPAAHIAAGAPEIDCPPVPESEQTALQTSFDQTKKLMAGLQEAIKPLEEVFGQSLVKNAHNPMMMGMGMNALSMGMLNPTSFLQSTSAGVSSSSDGSAGSATAADGAAAGAGGDASAAMMDLNSLNMFGAMQGINMGAMGMGTLGNMNLGSMGMMAGMAGFGGMGDMGVGAGAGSGMDLPAITAPSAVAQTTKGKRGRPDSGAGDDGDGSVDESADGAFGAGGKRRRSHTHYVCPLCPLGPDGEPRDMQGKRNVRIHFHSKQNEHREQFVRDNRNIVEQLVAVGQVPIVIFAGVDVCLSCRGDPKLDDHSTCMADLLTFLQSMGAQIVQAP